MNAEKAATLSDLGTVFKLARDGGWKEHEDAALKEARLRQSMGWVRLPDIQPGGPALPSSASATSERREGLVTQCLADIKKEPIQYGVGVEGPHSQAQAQSHRGRAWERKKPVPRPGRSHNNNGPRVARWRARPRKSVVCFTSRGKDGPADTIGPRFDAVCGNRKLFHIMNTVMDKDRNGVLRERPIRLDIDVHHIGAWFAAHPEFKTLYDRPCNSVPRGQEGELR